MVWLVIRKAIVVIFIVTLGIITGIIFFVKMKNTYNESMQYLAERKSRLIYSLPFQNFYNSVFEVPTSITEISEDRLIMFQGNRIKDEFRDPFRNLSYPLLYLPLYKDCAKKPTGFAVISAGIDRRLDFNTNKECIRFEEFLQSDDFYNDIDFTPGFFQGDFKDTLFRIRDYLFGNKDFIVEYIDCKEFYLNSYDQEKRVSQIFNDALLSTPKSSIQRRTLIYLDNNEGKIKYRINRNEIVATNGNYTALFKFHSRDELNGFKTTNLIVGVLTEIDFSNNLITYEYCLAKPKK